MYGSFQGEQPIVKAARPDFMYSLVEIDKKQKVC